MTTAMKRLCVSLYCLALLGGQSLASEPTPYPEPINETRPAVDGLNAKVSFAGVADDVHAFGAAGAVTVPLGHQFGLQIDGAAAEVDSPLIGDIPVFGAAAHLFWRDPSRGLLGLYGAYIHIDASESLGFYTGGIEGALYLGRFSIHGIVGMEDGDLLGSELFEHARLSYYPDENLVLHIGHSYSGEEHALLYGGEWALSSTAVATPSLFVDGVMAEDGHSVLAMGLRFYFGQRDKSLIKRHREDDPPSIGVRHLTTTYSDPNQPSYQWSSDYARY